MNITDIIEVDLPMIIILIVLWLIDFFKIREMDRKLDELKKNR